MVPVQAALSASTNTGRSERVFMTAIPSTSSGRYGQHLPEFDLKKRNGAAIRHCVRDRREQIPSPLE
jgi:hypothetical protein